MAAVRKLCRRLWVLPVAAMVLTVPVSAKTSYQTYTYSYQGDVQISPNVYTPLYELSDFGLELPLDKPQDMVVDKERGRIAIADTGNSRIVVLNTDFQCLQILTDYTDAQGNPVSFKEPQGVFVRDDGMLYVADTGNANIVSFDTSYRQAAFYPARTGLCWRFG